VAPDYKKLAAELATSLDELMQSEGNEPRTDPDNSPNEEEWAKAKDALGRWNAAL